MGKTLLFTGPSGCGKTTLIERAVRALQLPVRGFLTREIRQHGRRVDFSMNTLGGETAILAHVDFGGSYRVGKYGVDLDALNRSVSTAAESQKARAATAACAGTAAGIQWPPPEGPGRIFSSEK